MSQSCSDQTRLAGWCTAIGAESLEERRSELLWQYVAGHLEAGVASEIRQHLEACQDCRAALDAERLLRASRSSDRIVFAKCPSSEETLQYLERAPAQSPFRRLEIKMHLDKCELCRREAAWASERVVVAKPAAVEPASGWASWFTWKWAWGAAAAAVVLVSVLVYPTQFGSRRYAHLARLPDMSYEAVLAEFGTAHPADLPQFRAAGDMIQVGEYRRGEEILRQLESRYTGDPSIVFFQGYIAAREGRWREATLLCTRSEPHSLDGFRCWYLANVALKAGDLDLARKEIRHAKNHPPYSDSAIRLEKKMD